jgi:DNA-binding phage protein
VTLAEVFAAEHTTTSQRALLQEALQRRAAADPAWTQARLAREARMPHARVSEALGERCGEPRPDTVRRLLGALGFGLALVDLKAPFPHTLPPHNPPTDT